MKTRHTIAMITVLAAIAPLGMALAQVDTPAQQQSPLAQDQQAKERSQDADHRHDGKDQTNPEHRREMDKRQDAERRREAGQRQGAEQPQDAERGREDSPGNDAAARSMAPGQIRADDLVGQKVIHRHSHSDIGTISGLIMDDDGQIDSAIVRHGGFLGMFTKEVAIPWSQFEFSEDRKSVITDMDRRQMREATSYVRD